MMKRVHAPEKKSCSTCKSRQPEHSRFGPRSFAGQTEDSDLIGDETPRPLPNFYLMNLPLHAPVSPKLAAGMAGDGKEAKTESLQGKFGSRSNAPKFGLVQAKPQPNRTGMPDGLKAGIESLSGLDMSDVRVHVNSDKPAHLNALAYTQGNQIHLASGQERHLPHEAWHVVQQKQGRVRPTLNAKGLAINDDNNLECEADLEGQKAVQNQIAMFVDFEGSNGDQSIQPDPGMASHGMVAQLVKREEKKYKKPIVRKGTNPKDALKPKRKGYSIGKHGFKKREQKRLALIHSIPISGSIFESEHIVGFEPLNQTSGLKRGTQGRAKDLENNAPAYQERKELHRAHIGTGTNSKKDSSGFNSDEYRKYQRMLVESGDVSSAVQLNQLGYAFNPKFQSSAATPKGKAAQSSYETMVENMHSLTYAKSDEDKLVVVDAWQKAEMYLARTAAASRKWPSKDQIAEALKKFGLSKND